MEITSIGHQSFQAAQRRAEASSSRIVENGAEPKDVIDLKIAEKEAAVAAKVIKVGDTIHETLLDILA